MKREDIEVSQFRCPVHGAQSMFVGHWESKGIDGTAEEPDRQEFHCPHCKSLMIIEHLLLTKVSRD